MAKQTVNIGSAPNDGTGDTVRDAMDKINDNFDEVYSSLSFGSSNTLIVANTINVSNAVLMGNSFANVFANSTLIRIANTTFITNVNPSGVSVGTSTINSTAIAAGANIFLTTTSFFAGNSIVNTTVTQTGLRIANSSVNTQITLPSEAQTGNSFFLHANGEWSYIDVNGNPSGSNTQIQFNKSGEFGTNASFTFDESTTTLSVGNSSVNTTVNSSSLVVSSIVANGSVGTAGHTLHSNGTTIYWDLDDNAGGTVTSVDTGDGLTGGPITNTGTLSVVANSGLTANTSGVFVVPGDGLVEANSTGVHVGAGDGITVNSTAVSILANTGIVANSTGIFVDDTHIGTLSANSATYLGADSNFGNTSGLYTDNLTVGNSSINAVINSTSLTIGNTFANSSYLEVETANVSSNTLTLGTANVSSNGYSRLPNGLLMQWGMVSSNSSTGDITYSDTFTTVYSVTTTSDIAGAYDLTHTSLIIASNTSTANVRTANDVSINVSYLAIGV